MVLINTTANGSKFNNFQNADLYQKIMKRAISNDINDQGVSNGIPIRSNTLKLVNSEYKASNMIS